MTIRISTLKPGQKKAIADAVKAKVTVDKSSADTTMAYLRVHKSNWSESDKNKILQKLQVVIPDAKLANRQRVSRAYICYVIPVQTETEIESADVFGTQRMLYEDDAIDALCKYLEKFPNASANDLRRDLPGIFTTTDCVVGL